MQSLAKEKCVALAGNPNSGKTTIFNQLTGQNQKVANWSGVTVERKDGFLKRENSVIRITDLPGMYSLQANSPDEDIASKFVKGRLENNEKPDLIVQVIDGGNLQRSLFLTIQFLELELPIILVLNMWDEVKRRGVKIDPARLSKILGVPVITTVGNRGVGLNELVTEIDSMLLKKDVFIKTNEYDLISEKAIAEIKSSFSENKIDISRYEALEYLAAEQIDAELSPSIRSSITAVQKNNPPSIGSNWQESITHSRYEAISRLLAIISGPDQTSKSDSLTEKLDRIFLNRYLGLPIFLLIMAMMFHITFVIGAIPMGWIEIGIGYISDSVKSFMPDIFITSILTDGIIAGAGMVLVFLPNIILLLMGIHLLEDSGYMSRAAFLMDRIMRLMGLHGKAFIPMLMGFGCNVPALMASRTLDNKRDRLLTMLLVPLMSCSARLPVYVMIAAAFFATWGGLIIFSLYFLGTLTALVVGKLMGKTLLKGGSAPFIMELPPYRWPTKRTTTLLLRYTVYLYLKRIASVVMILAVFIWLLSNYPQPKATQIAGNTETEIVQTGPLGESTALYKIGKLIEPVFKPMDYTIEMNIALISGFVAKEVVVATFGILFTGSEEADELTITEHLRKNIPSSASALSFLVFVLLYTPCLTTVVTLQREAKSWYWTTISIVYQTVIAYLGAWGVYLLVKFIAPV